MDKLIVVLAAAGLGKRLGLGKNKAFVFLGKAPIMAYNLKGLNNLENLDRVIVVVGQNEIEEATELLTKFEQEYFPNVKWTVVAGGAERQDSVMNALGAIEETEGFVAVHDGARPFADKDVFLRVLEAAKKTGAAIAAVPVKDTIKTVNKEERVIETPNRSALRAVQTPQIFSIGLLKTAYANIRQKGITVTDDAGAVETLGVEVAVAEGSYENNKITTPEDLVWAEALLKKKGEIPTMETIRVGSGFDVHKLGPNRKLIICGVKVPYELGLIGHSDADVGTHALMDAMLGALGLGDIGKHFPDTDETYKDANSIKLLEHVVKLLEEKDWQVGNADVTIIAQMPKMAPFREEMENILAATLKIAKDRINVKATTTEQLGFPGRGEGIAAQAMVTLVRSE